jgi:hypothetical protein
MRGYAWTAAAVGMLLALEVRAGSTPGVLEFAAKIQGASTGFAPRHVAAVWIEDAQGRFVKTLLLRGQKQKKKLEAWRAASGGNVADAVTGATYAEWGGIEAVWDGRDKSGADAPDGVYRLCAETAWRNEAGPRIEGVKFEKGPGESRPAGPDADAFRDIRVAWKPGTASGAENPPPAVPKG